MGTCKSVLQIEDDEEREAREKSKRIAREMREFSEQLRKTRCVASELDLNGRPTSRAETECIRMAMDIVYDA